MPEEEKPVPPPTLPVQELPVSPFFLRTIANRGFKAPAHLLDPALAEKVKPPTIVKTLDDELAELDESQSATLSEFRNIVKEKGLGDVNDWTLLRYLRARQWKLKKAVPMLEASLKWRKENEPTLYKCMRCNIDPNNHFMEFIGWDLEHHPVMLSGYRWGTDRTSVDCLRHTLETFDHVVAQMPGGVEQWVVVMDFVGYSHMTDGNSKVGKDVVSILADHYPERLAYHILVDPPTLFWVFWKLLGPFIDPETKKKVRFLYTDSKPRMQDEFPKLFPQHMYEYLYETFARHKLPDSGAIPTKGGEAQAKADDATPTPAPAPAADS